MHKANIMKFTDGLFLRIAGDVAKRLPGDRVPRNVSSTTPVHAARKADLYDMLVLPNLYGDIVQATSSPGLVGRRGVAAGREHRRRRVAVFEAIHGSAPQLHRAEQKAEPDGGSMLAGVLICSGTSASARPGDSLGRAIASMVADGERRDLRPQGGSRRPDRRRHEGIRRRRAIRSWLAVAHA